MAEASTVEPWFFHELKSSKEAAKIFERESLEVDQRVYGLSDVKTMGSYNWSPVSTPEKPEIIVPGAPRKKIEWGRTRNRDEQLVPNSELAEYDFVDENHYMIPKHPLEPLFGSIEKCREIAGKEKLDYQAFDFVTDSANLKKLFAFFKEPIPPAHRIYEDRAFRIDLEKIGRLVCFVRRSDEDRVKSPSHVYGADFEGKITKPTHDYWTTGSFRQISAFKLGNLDMIVRYQVDCADYDRSIVEEEDLSDVFSSKMIKDEPRQDSNLHIVRYGPKKAEYHNVELATRISGKPFVIFTYPDMFFSNISTLVVAWQWHGAVKHNQFHQQARGDRPERYGGLWTYEMDEVQEKYGGFPTETMGKVLNLLEEILDFVREEPASKKWALIFEPEKGDEGKILKVYERDTVESVLPESYMPLILES